MKKESKLYENMINTMLVILLIVILLGSLCAAFTTFVFINAVIGTCYFLVNEPGVFIEPKTATMIMTGSGVIGFIVYVKCYIYLSRLLTKWKIYMTIPTKKGGK